MIENSVAIWGLLLWGIATSCASSLTSEEEFKICSLGSFNAKVKLLNDWKDVLERSVHAYIPYHEESSLFGEPKWMYNIYSVMLKKHEKKYDICYVDISENNPSNILFITDGVGFVYTPYLEIPEYKEKIYDSQKLNGIMWRVEEELFLEKNPEKVMGLVRQLYSMKETSYKVESYSKRLPDEITEQMVRIMEKFQKLQPKSKRLKGDELNALRDYMWSSESLNLQFYGLDSSLFGVSMRCFTEPGSPPIYVRSILNDLIWYIKSDSVHEQMDLEWLKGEMKELPFVKDCH